MSEWNFLTLKKAGVQLIDCVHNTPEAQTEGYYYIAIPPMKDGQIDPADARLISKKCVTLIGLKSKLI